MPVKGFRNTQNVKNLWLVERNPAPIENQVKKKEKRKSVQMQ